MKRLILHLEVIVALTFYWSSFFFSYGIQARKNNCRVHLNLFWYCSHNYSTIPSIPLQKKWMIHRSIFIHILLTPIPKIISNRYICVEHGDYSSWSTNWILKFLWHLNFFDVKYENMVPSFTGFIASLSMIFHPIESGFQRILLKSAHLLNCMLDSHTTLFQWPWVDNMWRRNIRKMIAVWILLAFYMARPVHKSQNKWQGKTWIEILFNTCLKLRRCLT